MQGLPAFPQNYSRQDMGVNEAVLNFVTNFCKTGDPNEAGQQQIPLLHPDYGTAKERTRFRLITWETYETTTQQYLSICKCFLSLCLSAMLFNFSTEKGPL